MRFLQKTLVFCALALIASTIVKAQAPTILGTYLPVKNTAIQHVYDTLATQLTVPVQDTGVYWDYSNKFTNIVDTMYIRTFDKFDSPYHQHFPNATHATFLRAPFPWGDSLWNYIRIDTSGVYNVGGFNEKSTYDTTLTFQDEEIFMPFVVKQGDFISDSARFVTYFTNGNFDYKLVETAYKELNYAGYGTLATPVGTYNDVVLGREVTDAIDSVFVWSGNSWTYLINTPVQKVRYHFLRNNTFATTHLMLLEADYNETQIEWGWFTLPVEVGSISGHVADSLGNDVISGKAFLYRDNSNFTKNDVLAKAILDGSGNFQFDSIPYGEYRIAIRPGISYPNALTTYYGDTTDWETAATVITNSPTTTGVDISLEYAPATSSNNTLVGNVSGLWGFNFSKKGNNYNYILGEPVSGINVSLEQIPGGAVAMQTETDAGGDFELSNAPDGDYKLWVDIPGMAMSSSYTLNISGNTVTNLDFVTDMDSIYATQPTGLLNSLSLENELTVFPNPFTQELNIIVHWKENSNYQLVIHDILSKPVHTQKINSSNNTLNTEKLPSGIYFVSLYENGELYSSEKVVKP